VSRRGGPRAPPPPPRPPQDCWDVKGRGLGEFCAEAVGVVDDGRVGFGNCGCYGGVRYRRVEEES